jgi:hypothetical protein
VSPTFSVRLTPLGPETVWSLEDGTLVQQRGRRRSVHPLSKVTQLVLAPAGPKRPHPSLRLRLGPGLGLRQVAIPAAGFGRLGVEARPQAFAAFARALAAAVARAAPKARFAIAAGANRRAPLLWAIALLAAGAAGMLLTAFSSVVGGLGLTLAAWLAFAALLLSCALPWLNGPRSAFDPLAIPDGLLA